MYSLPEGCMQDPRWSQARSPDPCHPAGFSVFPVETLPCVISLQLSLDQSPYRSFPGVQLAAAAWTRGALGPAREGLRVFFWLRIWHRVLFLRNLNTSPLSCRLWKTAMWGVSPSLHRWMAVAVGTLKERQPGARHCAPTYRIPYKLFIHSTQ